MSNITLWNETFGSLEQLKLGVVLGCPGMEVRINGERINELLEPQVIYKLVK